MTRRASAGQRGLLVFLDQVASSGSNFIFVLLVARASSIADFGTFVLVFSVITFSLGLTRASLGVPLSTDIRALPSERRREFVARTLAVGLTASCAVAFAVVALAIFLNPSRPMFHALLLISGCVPVIVAQDIGRYIAIAQAAPVRALFSDSTWLIVSGAALSYFAMVGQDDVVRAVAAWAAGAVVSLAGVLGILAKPIWRGTGGWFLRDARRRHLSWDALLGGGAPLICTALVGGLASMETVGALRGATTLMTPVNVLIAAASVAGVAELASRPTPSARMLGVALSAMMGLATIVWGVVVLMMPDSLGSTFMGDTWAVSQSIVPLTILEFLGLSLWTGAIVLMRAKSLTLPAVKLRLGYAGLVIVTVTLAASIWSSAHSIQIAMATAAATAGTIGWFVTIRLLAVAPCDEEPTREL